MHLKRTTAYALFVFLTLLSCHQSNTNNITFKATTHVCNETVRQESLIVAEYSQNYHGKGGDFIYLTSYNFQAGKLLSKDTILGAPSDSMNTKMRFYWGSSFYKNRYVISSNGCVFDLETKSFFDAKGDEFIRRFGDSLIFHRDTLYPDDNERERLHKLQGTGFWILDLKTQKYELAKAKNGMALKGLLSPDLKHGLEVDMAARRFKPFTKPYKIILHNAQQETKNIVENCGFGTPQSKISSHQSNVPVHWVDNKHFIYGKYFTPVLSLFFTMKSRVEIRLVNIETGTDELIGNIKSIPPSVGDSEFSENWDGSLVFDCRNGRFRVDLPAKQVYIDTSHQINHQFQIESDSTGSKITFKNEKIGKIWSFGAIETCGYFAAEYGDFGSNLGYPKGIKIWNRYTQDWTNIDIQWISTLIGWK
jgi:hypothetical protein